VAPFVRRRARRARRSAHAAPAAAARRTEARRAGARAQDIAAIEARNNRLERQSRHNARLQAALEALLERLTLPERSERALAHAPFTADTCAARRARRARVGGARGPCLHAAAAARRPPGAAWRGASSPDAPAQTSALLAAQPLPTHRTCASCAMQPTTAQRVLQPRAPPGASSARRAGAT
jgi:hypothetical protein